MIILEILRNIVVSVLVGYLALTNSLAEKIESLLPAPQESEVTEPSPETTGEIEEERLEKVPGISKRSIPRILLDHLEFQRASVIASKRTEEAVSIEAEEPIEQIVKNALVNVFCQYKTKEFIRTTTGTGFFINQKGVILTNAHVAQFLILKDTENIPGEVECVIRSGDPATPKYHAELLYISPTWIFDNAKQITDEAPRGTGERDYALLYVSKTLDGTPLPVHFPAIPIDVELLARSVAGTSVMTAGYPAEVLLRNGADAKLTPVVADAVVGTLYTFGSNYADIFSISESVVGEQGASGGPIIPRTTNGAIGLIVTKGDVETEGMHSLRAITLSYVDRTIIEETGFSLLQNMQGDVAYRGNVFKSAMVPFLSQILEQELTAKTPL